MHGKEQRGAESFRSHRVERVPWLRQAQEPTRQREDARVAATCSAMLPAL